jgi:polyisoprenyl-teichoic acid--peptidoglycan teichoic acid transferase
MNSRKFYLILSTVLSIFLFLVGIASLLYLKTNNTKSDNGIFSEILDPFKLSSEPVNILVLGGDKVAKNTDTMMLVNFNPATAKLNILSIPRDTKVKVKGSNLPKINSAFPIGGANLAVDTVSSFLNVKIKYYVFIDTQAFRKIIDILGGVDINVPVDMDYDDPFQNLHVHLKKGEQHMDGALAEQFVRFRHPNNYKNKEVMQYYDGSDLKRIDAQQNFIKELIRQKANVLYLTKLNDIVDEVFTNLETNLNLSDALKLAQSLDKLSLSNVTMFKLPGNDDDEGSAGWYYACDKAKTAEIIKENFTANGGFVNNNTSNKNTNSNEKNTEGTVPKKAPAAPKPKPEETKIDVTKDNPSNTESSIKSPSPGAP